MIITNTDVYKFYKHVSFGFGEDACWTWTGEINPRDGRGRVYIGGRNRQATAVSYEIHHETSVGDLFVLHICDNPSCVNPYHVFLGTQSDNMKDMFKKGRKNHGGENAPAHKLTTQAVIEIRDLYKNGIKTPKQLSELYDSSCTNIWCIIKNRTFVGV